jgi:molybdopterin-synthase adenylyltransferase
MNMRYQVVLPANVAEQLRQHILSDRSKEQLAITLCGIDRRKDETRLLCRKLIILKEEAFARQSSAYLELLPEVQGQILELASRENLSQIDWHSHPGESSFIRFSNIDDHHEKALAGYLNEKIPGTFYGSVVMNHNAFDARIWDAHKAKAIDSINWGYFNPEQPSSREERGFKKSHELFDERFSRQVLAFGSALQDRLRILRIGIIGVGGIGGVMVEMLSRLGVGNWVLVDDDVVETTNLNRLPGSSLKDVYQRTPKVRLAQRNIAKSNPYARVIALNLPVTNLKALRALKSCDLLIVATDNHSSRLIANRLSLQYLIPLIHVGVNIDVDEEKKITDVSAEFAIPPLGQWCLECAGIFDTQLAGWELADEEMQRQLWERGYVKDTPAPAVYHLNGLIASLAVAEIHNLIIPYKPIRRYLAYDELKSELLSLDVQPKDDCPVCSGEGGLIGLGDLEPLPDFETHREALPFADLFDSEEPEAEHLDPLTESSDFC